MTRYKKIIEEARAHPLRSGIICLSILIILPVARHFWALWHPPVIPAPTLFKVVVMKSTAEERPFQKDFFGEAIALRSVTMRAEVNTSVNEIYVNEGDRVTKGKRLMALHARDIPQRVKEAKLLVAQRQKELNIAEALGKRNFRSKVSIEESRTALETARSQLQSLEVSLRSLTLLAPFDGVVHKLSVKEEQYVTVGDTLLMFVQDDPVSVQLRVNERDLHLVKAGQEADIYFADGQTHKGKVFQVVRVADDVTHLFPVTIHLKNTRHDIPIGGTATVNLPLQSGMAHKVPLSALTLGDGGILGLKIVRQGKAEFLPVTLSKTRENIAFVVPENSSDQLDIIILGQEYVQPGEAVNVTLKDAKDIFPQ